MKFLPLMIPGGNSGGGAGYYAYPNFPTYTSVTQFVIALLEWIILVPLTAIANFIIAIAGALQQGGQSSAVSISAFIGETWNNSIQSFSSLGVFAIVVASLMWGISIMILIFFVFKAIQLSIRETEED